MGKTLHIIPSGNIWPRIVGKWIGEGPEFDEVFVWHAEDVDSQFEDVKVYTDRDVDIDSITRDSFEVGTANKILPSFGCATNFLCNHETRNYKNA